MFLVTLNKNLGMETKNESFILRCSVIASLESRSIDRTMLNHYKRPAWGKMNCYVP